MKQLEDALPRDISFDSSICELWDFVEVSLDTDRTKKGDVIDYELSESFLQFQELSQGLANTLMPEDEDPEAVSSAIYRGMCFALQTVKIIKSSPIETIDISSIIADDGVTTAEEIIRQSAIYISQRDQIAQLLDRFMPEIDQTYAHNHYVEIGATLMFMLTERQQASEILNSEAENLTPEMFTEPL